MRKMTERFQRWALVSEAARLEQYIIDQQGVNDRLISQSPQPLSAKLEQKLNERSLQLEKCRETANALRLLVWALD